MAYPNLQDNGPQTAVLGRIASLNTLATGFIPGLGMTATPAASVGDPYAPEHPSGLTAHVALIGKAVAQAQETLAALHEHCRPLLRTSLEENRVSSVAAPPLSPLEAELLMHARAIMDLTHHINTLREAMAV